MRWEIATILVVLALLVGAGAGYFWLTSQTTATTQTAPTTYTTTLPGRFGVERCVLSRVIVYNIEYTSSSGHTNGLSTQTVTLDTYFTTTPAIQTVGFATTTTATYSEYSAVAGVANVTACTYIAG